MPAHASRTLVPARSAPPSRAERRLLAPAPPGERRHTRRTLRQPGSPPRQASIGGFGLSSELNQLQEALGDSAADDLWRPTISRLRRLRFDLLAAPISPQALDLDEAWQELSRQRTHAEKAEYGLLPAVARTLEALESLGQTTANPLFDAVVDLAVHSMEAVTVLLCESRLLQSAQAAVEKAGRAEHIRLTVPHELRVASPMDALTVIGAPRWFPSHVFAAPRAPNFFVIRHEWIAVDWKGLWKPFLRGSAGR